MSTMLRRPDAVLLIAGLAFVAGCGSQPLGTGSALPPLRVSGWTNGSPLDMGDVVGKVVVLEVFATW